MDTKGLIAGVALAGMTGPVIAQEAPEPAPAPVLGSGIFAADILPLNNSGVRGTGILSKEGERLTVVMAVEGLETGVEHQQHIHGGATDTTGGACPTLADDQDGDNLISLEEAGPVVGDVILGLEPFPSPTGDTVHFTQTYELDAESGQALQQLTDNVVVLHGQSVQNAYDPTQPVACAVIRPLSVIDAGNGDGGAGDGGSDAGGGDGGDAGNGDGMGAS